MKFTINKKELLEAIEKCVSVKDTYTISFTTRKDESGYRYSTISAGDSNSLSCITFMAAADTDQSVKVIVGTEFYDAVKALSPSSLGDAIVLEILENNINVLCGNAVIPLGVKSDALTFNFKSPKVDAHSRFEIDAKELKRVIKQGSYASGNYDVSAGGTYAAITTVFLLPVNIGEGVGIRIISTDGYFGTSSIAAVEGDASFLQMANAQSGICLPPSTIEKISSVLSDSKISVFLFDTQMIVKDGNDVYAIIPKNYSYPLSVIKGIDEVDYTYKFTAKVADVKIALGIAMVNTSVIDAKKVMVLDIDLKEVVVSAAQTANKTVLKTLSSEGNVKVALSCKQLRDILHNGISSETVTIYGKGDNTFVHVVSEKQTECSAFTLPVSLTTQEE